VRVAEDIGADFKQAVEKFFLGGTISVIINDKEGDFAEGRRWR
jgi:hypothetical protein